MESSLNRLKRVTKSFCKPKKHRLPVECERKLGVLVKQLEQLYAESTKTTKKEKQTESKWIIPEVSDNMAVTSNEKEDVEKSHAESEIEKPIELDRADFMRDHPGYTTNYIVCSKWVIPEVSDNMAITSNEKEDVEESHAKSEIEKPIELAPNSSPKKKTKLDLEQWRADFTRDHSDYTPPSPSIEYSDDDRSDMVLFTSSEMVDVPAADSDEYDSEWFRSQEYYSDY